MNSPRELRTGGGKSVEDRYRVAGMGLTFTVILVSAAHILITALRP